MRSIIRTLAVALAFTATSGSAFARLPGGATPGSIGIDPICFVSPYDPRDPSQAIACCTADFPIFAMCDDVLEDALYAAAQSGDPADALTYGRLAKAKVEGGLSIEGTIESVFWGACMVGSTLGWIAGGGAIDQATDEAVDNCAALEDD